MASLAIVWRNPKPVRNQRRCLEQEQVGDRTLYVVQQLLSSQRDIWVNTPTFFEVIRGRKAAGTAKELAQRWRFGLGW